MTVTTKQSVITKAEWVRDGALCIEDTEKRGAPVLVPEGSTGEALQMDARRYSALVETKGVVTNGETRLVRIWLRVELLEKAKQ